MSRTPEAVIVNVIQFRRRRLNQRGFMSALSLMSVLALAACAPNPANASSAPPAVIAAAAHACADTMGLNPSEAEYAMCTRELLRTVRQLDRPRLVAQDRAACAARGLQPGTTDFALCVVAENQPRRY